MPAGTTAQRDGSPAAGYTRFNSTLGVNETYSGSVWLPDGWQRGSSVTLAGTATDLSGFPAGINEAAIAVEGASTNGTSQPVLRLGDSGGIEATGYAGAGARVEPSTAAALDTTGFRIESGNAANVLHGLIRLTRISGNTWACNIELAATNSAFCFIGGGVKTLSDVLTSIRLTTVGGANTFDAGTITPLWRY
jgi:hypothetical protein